MTTDIVVQKHFVTFYSPGTFVAETTSRLIDGWDVEVAKEMARTVLERHNATPYGFRFSTNGRGENDLDSREIARSPMYYLGGAVRTYEEVVADNDPKEEILRTNMRINDIKRVITNDNSWRFTGAVDDADVVLDWKP
jgi:hypothetical protein